MLTLHGFFFSVVAFAPLCFFLKQALTTFFPYGWFFFPPWKGRVSKITKKHYLPFLSPVFFFSPLPSESRFPYWEFLFLLRWRAIPPSSSFFPSPFCRNDPDKRVLF